MTSPLQALLKRSKELREQRGFENLTHRNFCEDTAKAKDEIITVLLASLENHSCCLVCEPCPGCTNQHAIQKAQAIAERAMK
jgi:hypothetical protein